MRLCPFILVALAGCDALFGIDHIDPAADAPAGPSTVTVHTFFSVITNSPQGTPVVTTMNASVPWKVQLADGSQPPITQAADGTLSFERARADQAYRWYFGNATSRAEYQLDVPHLELGSRYWGRMDRDAPLAGTQLVYSVPNALNQPGMAYITTTGLWSMTYVGSNPSAFTIDWQKATSLYGGVGLIRQDKNDRAYYILEQNVGGYVASTGYRADNIMMAQGATTTAGGDYAPLVRDQCIHVNAGQLDEANRLASAFGTTSSSFGATWLVRAIPGTEVTPEVGFTTAYNSMAIGSVTNIDMNVASANPYPGHILVLGMSINRQRSIQLGSATPIVLNEGSLHFVLPEPSCATPSSVSGIVGIPHDIALGGVSLAAANQSTMIDRSGPIPITWQTGPGTVDGYRVFVQKLINAGGATGLQNVAQLDVRGSVALLEPSLVEPGGTYVIDVFALLGYPTPGDTATFAFPWGEAYSASSTFVVAN